MAYCHECGEQVAENDGFCPHCGITLQHPAVVESSVKTPPTPFDVPTQAAAKDVLSANTTEKKAEDFSNDITADNLNVQMESVAVPSNTTDSETPPVENQQIDNSNAEEIQDESAQSDFSQQPVNDTELAEVPMPKILETLKPVVESADLNKPCPEDESMEASAAQESKLAEIMEAEGVNLEPVFVSTEGETVEDEIGANGFQGEIPDEPATDSEIKSSLKSDEEAEEDLSPDEFNKWVDEELERTKDVEPIVGNQAENNFNEPPASSQIETPAVAELPIVMPAAELPVAESFPPSRFDSVSIMEKTEQPVEQKREEVAAVETPAEEQKSERSFTTPNIGTGSDTDGKNKTKLKPLDEGTVLNGRYEIIRKIGGGGMGAVYLASDKNLGGVLRAVKEMVQSYIEDVQQEKAVSDFKRESLLLTSLDHQSIPTIYDYFFDESEARFYLVMKYISGGDLAGRLRSAPEGRIDETSITQWAVQIADVLDYLHNRQPPIVYRDLKPANIMIDGNSGRVMLIDFGIARWVNKEEKGVTAVGTMGYAPPELFSGNVEARSDIYSLGSTMFHLLTGADPQSNPLLIFDFQKHPRPRQINPQLSDQMERILMQAVEYNADKRFASAAELRKTLEEHLENLKANKVSFGVKEAPISIALSDQPVFCGFCGQKIVATDMFCAFCGAKQPLAQQGVHSHSEGYAPAPLTAQLLIVGTNELEQPAFRLEKEDNLVGRRDPMSNIFPEVDLSKFDPQTKISRRHARIWREGSEFMVEDLGSSNGTYILPVVSDTMRLQPHQPQLLTNGDKIRLGDTTLHFILG